MSDLPARLRKLGFLWATAHLDDWVSQATRQRSGPREWLEQWVAHEEHERQQRSQQRRLTQARLGRFKPMVDFDWAWPRQLDRPLVEAALRLDFLGENRNIVLVAAQGLGKTMIAQNVAYQAVLAGHSVLFTTASQLLLDLGAQETARALERRLRHYSKVRLLIVDEVGYLSYDARSADLLFQLVNRRYEERSLVLTTNLAFRDWHTVFPNAACATALIDRIVHHADVVKIEGDSYRLRDAEQRKKARRPKSGE